MTKHIEKSLKCVKTTSNTTQHRILFTS